MRIATCASIRSFYLPLPPHPALYSQTTLRTGRRRPFSPGHGLGAGAGWWVWPAAAPGARQKKFKFIQMRSIGIIELICGLLLVAGSS
jgi:hypothetical protein